MHDYATRQWHKKTKISLLGTDGNIVATFPYQWGPHTILANTSDDIKRANPSDALSMYTYTGGRHKGAGPR